MPAFDCRKLVFDFKSGLGQLVTASFPRNACFEQFFEEDCDAQLARNDGFQPSTGKAGHSDETSGSFVH
jgi:hypothetical protein